MSTAAGAILRPPPPGSAYRCPVTGKWSYETKQAAREAARRTSARGAPDTGKREVCSVLKCGACPGYHVGRRGSGHKR